MSESQQDSVVSEKEESSHLEEVELLVQNKKDDDLMQLEENNELDASQEQVMEIENQPWELSAVINDNEGSSISVMMQRSSKSLENISDVLTDELDESLELEEIKMCCFCDKSEEEFLKQLSECSHKFHPQRLNNLSEINIQNSEFLLKNAFYTEHDIQTPKKNISYASICPAPAIQHSDLSKTSSNYKPKINICTFKLLRKAKKYPSNYPKHHPHSPNP